MIIYRDRVIKWSKDLQVTVDYLNKLQMVNRKIYIIWDLVGARLSGIMLATEKDLNLQY